MKRKLGVTATAGVLAVVLTLALTACGGSGDSDGVASLPDSTGQSTTNEGSSAGASQQDPQEAALAYARCMRAHGIDVPDPDANGGVQLNAHPGDEAKIKKAQDACGDILQRSAPKLSKEQQSALQDGLLAFAKCMRKHGIDMPDPQFGEGGIVTQKGGPGSGPDPNDPKFKEAQEACEPIVQAARRKADLPKSSESPGFSTSGGGS
jgi:hypothetical protein